MKNSQSMSASRRAADGGVVITADGAVVIIEEEGADVAAQKRIPTDIEDESSEHTTHNSSSPLCNAGPSWEEGGGWMARRQTRDSARLERPTNCDRRTMAARGETVLSKVGGLGQEITYRVFQADAVVGVTTDSEFDQDRCAGGAAWGYRQCGDFFYSTDDAFKLGDEDNFAEGLKAPQVDKFHLQKLNAYELMRVEGFIVKIRVEWPDRSIHVSVEGKPFRTAPCAIPADVEALRPWVFSEVDFCVVQLVAIEEVEPGAPQLPLPAWHTPVVSSADAAGPSGSSGAGGGPAPQRGQRQQLEQQRLEMPQRKRAGKRRLGEFEDDFDRAQEQAERRADGADRAREDALAAAEDEVVDVGEVPHKGEQLSEEDQEAYEGLREFYLAPRQKPRRRVHPERNQRAGRQLRDSTLCARIEELKLFVNGRMLGPDDELDSKRFVKRLATKLNLMHEHGHRVWPLQALRVIAKYEELNFFRAEPLPAWLRQMILGPDAEEVHHTIDLTEDDIPDSAEVIDLLGASFASSLPPLPPDEMKLENVLDENIDFE